MVLEAIMTRYNPCVKYELQTEVLEYLSYVEKEPFYVSPVFESVKTDVAESTLNPKFVLFSALISVGLPPRKLFMEKPQTGLIPVFISCICISMSCL